MIYDFEVKEIDKHQALEMVQKYHYSNTLPKLNKHFLGFFLNNELVGMITLGWGTRPLHTIQKIFPSLTTKDYYEIGRMCMTEDMPRNSESQMISHCVKWLKHNQPEIKVLFTWADGMLGKVGYVYQACSFLYAGYFLTDIYMKDGVKIHPRQTRALFKIDENDTRKTIRPTTEQMKEFNIQHFKGKQYKYLTFLCSKTEKKRLLKESLIELSLNYPKEDDLEWKVKSDNGWIQSKKPPYKTDMNHENYDIANINMEEQEVKKVENVVIYKTDKMFDLVAFKEKEPELFEELIKDYPCENITYIFEVEKSA